MPPHRSDTMADQRTLIDELMDPRAYPHAAEKVERIETHISTVLLAGAYAYKIKKPVNLGFLDFSTLALRRHYCEEELRLNRRLAPDLYLDVVGIRRDGGSPQLCSTDATGVVEYAVKMKRFEQHALLDRVLATGELTSQQIDALAQAVAAFHSSAPRLIPEHKFGRTATQEALLRQNFEQIRALLTSGTVPHELDDVERWSRAEHAALASAMEKRRSEGYVRECHGDLHLGNIALIDGAIQIFDGIEFNADLRWIDVINEVAFLVMDLNARGRADLGARFLNAYLEITGDYAGIRLLRAYLVYRAMVRAKVACIRLHQVGLGGDARRAAEADFMAYLRLARDFTQQRKPWLLVTHGVSGSGKTTITQALLEAFGTLRVRSDLERKRLHGYAGAAHTGSSLGAGVYGRSATEVTYEELQRLARLILQAGWPVIVDATFLQRNQRDLFRALARDMDVPFLALACYADADELRRRIVQRSAQGTDASEATIAVLEQQLRAREPLTADERGQSIEVDTAHCNVPGIVEAIRHRLWQAPSASV